MASETIADRNLLIGILAVQNYLVDNDQLILAMQKWLADKSVPLEDILVDQSVLSDAERTLLAALTEHHLAKHNQKAQKSLEALSAISSDIRGNLQELCDDHVNASLVHIPATLDRTSTYEAPSISDGIRYKVLRKHAHGGLGDVFVAMDEELKRDVALKQIQERFADDPGSRSRFMLEAEVTGRLEHPGIVPVYGLGFYDDGRPFYAMRFVRGDSLHEAIEAFHLRDQRDDWTNESERSIQLRKLLGRFLDVCDAIEYAHSRGVLHRDLKPGNVMLGNHGETLVVDWGLAKLVQPTEEAQHVDVEPPLDDSRSGDSQTQMGTTVGTPAYMSPEQAAGRLDLLDGRSDVYSLGATLFCLLTGQPPLKGGTPEEIRRQVEKGRLPKPREINATVPRPLEAICLKAMSRDPQERYSSPSGLAEDIEHWLADEPVTAFSDPILVRSARWARHHKVSVAALLMLLVTGLVSVSISAAMLSKANLRILAAQRQAEENEKIANQNYQLAKNAVDDYLTKVSEETLLDQPGMQPLRKELLTQALDYYREFVELRADDPAAKAELATAHLRTGTIMSTLGSHNEAISEFRQSLVLASELSEDVPTSAAHTQLLASAHGKLANEFHTVGKYSDALEQYELTVQTLNPLIDTPHASEVARLEIAQYLIQTGTILDNQGNRAKALDLYERAEGLVRGIDESSGLRDEIKDVLARSLHNQSNLHREARRFQQALTPIKEAVEIRENLVSERPDVQGNQSKLALSLGAMSSTFSDLGRHQEAHTLKQRILKIRTRLAQENPAVVSYREDLASSQLSLATTERILGNLDQAKELSERAAETLTLLVQRYPNVLEYREQLALTYYNFGNLFLGDPASRTSISDGSTEKRRAEFAIEQYLSSIAEYQHLVDIHPEIPGYSAQLASSLNNCGSAYHLLGDEENSRAMQQRALEIRESLVTDNPTPDYKDQLASSLFNSAGDETESEVKFEKIQRSADLRQALVDEFPDVPAYRAKLAFTLQGQAMHSFTAGNISESLPLSRRCISLYEELHSEFPDVEGYRQNLLQALDIQSIMLRLADQMSESEKALQRTVELQREWLVDHPEDISASLRLVKAIEGIGKCRHKLKQYSEACDYYEQGMEILESLPRSPATAPVLDESQNSLRELNMIALEKSGRFDKAADIADLIIADSEPSIGFEIQAARLHALAGDSEEASRRAEAIFAKLDPGGVVEYYNVACVFAIAAGDAQENEDADGRRSEFIQRAIQCLEKAKAGDYFTPDAIDNFGQDTDFDSIRDTTEMRLFLESLTTDS